MFSASIDLIEVVKTVGKMQVSGRSILSKNCSVLTSKTNEACFGPAASPRVVAKLLASTAPSSGGAAAWQVPAALVNRVRAALRRGPRGPVGRGRQCAATVS